MSSTTLKEHKIITWFAANPVFANLLLFVLLAAGVYTGLTIQKEGFPAFGAEQVTITVPILGSTPENVERGIAIPIEESLQDVAGIEHIRSTSREDLAEVTVEAFEKYPIDKLLNDIKIRVDAIPNFPEQAEKPQVREQEIQRQVLWIEIHGEASEATLKETARRLRDELLRQPDISLVETYGARDYEISIEPSEEKMRRFNLTFSEVADAIAANSLDLGAGVVRSPRGDISLRTRDQAYTQRDFEKIPLRTSADGTQIFVRDVATVRDGFVDQLFLSRFNGQPTVSLKVVTEGKEDLLNSVAQAREVANNWQDLPPGVTVSTWLDGSDAIRGRLYLLGKNGLGGILLVLLVLMLFLNFRLAFWVAVGIPVAMAGALACFQIPGIDLTINVISAFGFLVVLGIVVDDAIVVGESVYAAKERQKNWTDKDAALRATVNGVARIITPATFGVLTTVAAFLPLTQISGRLGNVFGQIAAAVILCLLFSIVESKLILPSHLAHIDVHKQPRNWFTKGWARFQGFFTGGLRWFSTSVFRPLLIALVPWRYAVLAGFFGILILTVSLLGAGKLRFVFFPDIFNDNMSVLLVLEQGQSVDYLHQQTYFIAEKAKQLGEKYYRELGHDPFRDIQLSASSNTQSSVAVELTESADRLMLPTSQILRDWRETVGPIAGARKLNFFARAGPPGGDLVINLESENLDDIVAAAAELKSRLETYPGTFDILDTFESGKPEIVYFPTASGRGPSQVTAADLGQNVRDAFYGREAQRVQRGREEIKVMVRYPYKERAKLETLREMRIRLPDGTAAPFGSVAKTEYGDALAAIERYDNKRVVTVEASIDKAITSVEEIEQRLQDNVYPDLQAQFPGLSFSPSGDIEQRMKSQKDLRRGFLLSIFFVYILLAVPLKSYTKPFAIMLVIPFGIIGALLGHWLMDIPVSILSIFGIIALSGIVVNDSLILVSRIDNYLDEGLPLNQAIIEAAPDRFRAILLTSVTTFFGLAPLLLETDFQAQFLKPMAISIGFGVLFATVITLILMPLALLAGNDVKRFFTR